MSGQRTRTSTGARNPSDVNDKGEAISDAGSDTKSGDVRDNGFKGTGHGG